MTALRAKREAMLEFVLLAAAEESARPFPETVIETLRDVVPCDTVAYRAWSAQTVADRSFAPVELAERWTVWLRYPEFRRDDPLPSEPPVPRDDRPPLSVVAAAVQPLLLSNRISSRRLSRTGLYHELMSPFGVRDVMKVFLPSDGSTGSVFVFDTSGRFTDDDRVRLRRLFPALVQLQRNARLRSTVLSGDRRLALLTPRERTVLGRAAAGESNVEIARTLFIGDSTVRKHLEHVYAKLEVRNRAAAVATYAAASRSR